ncbi:DUF6694 family lipoprotein [Maridesulfovibrio frigidus]|uniref:DUF6694 family lipoprotein n=1 Tax=Maridesulfovibrio frigidus TaxID=340956 RepID=UPI0004E17C58|nr:DUF6694 family lipoprotein [Maridesulfovibrio frigidus]
MNKRILAAILTLSLFILVGWSKAVVDTSSEQTFQTSISTIIKDISPEDKEKLRQSFAVIATGGAKTSIDSEMRIQDIYVLEDWFGPIFIRRLSSINGYTPNQINAHADSVLKSYKQNKRHKKIARLEKRLKESSLQLSKLRAQKEAQDKAITALSQLEVSSTHQMTEQLSVTGKKMGLINKAKVHVTIKNNSDKEIHSLKVGIDFNSNDKKISTDEIIAFSPALQPKKTTTVDLDVDLYYEYLKLSNNIQVSTTATKLQTSESYKLSGTRFSNSEGEYVNYIQKIKDQITDLKKSS